MTVFVYFFAGVIVLLVFSASSLLAEDSGCAKAGVGQVVTIDAHNRVLLGGQPFFPLGLYVVQCTNGQYKSQLKEIENSPFDTLVNYAVNGCGTDATNTQILDYLDALKKRSLKLIFSLKDYIGHGERDLDAIREKIGTFKDHPAALAWYMNDELGPEHLPDLETRYKLAKSTDPCHPVWSVHWNTQWLIQEAHATDIVGVDPYPIGNHPITLVSKMADQAGRSGKPLWLVSQIFDWRDHPWDSRAKTGRAPTRDEMRAMAYLATNHGAKGLIFYSYFNIRDDADYAFRWKAIKEVAQEIKALKSVFLSNEVLAEGLISVSDPAIDAALKKHEEDYYLFCVNTLERELKNVAFTLHQHTSRNIHVLFENERNVIVENGVFHDHFQPYEVHVYCWKMMTADKHDR